MHRIHRQTRSNSLKQKLEALQKPSLRQYSRNDSTLSDQSNTDKTLSLTEIQARLWSLLQQAMLDPRAWPRWNANILDTSTLPSRGDFASRMLDEDPHAPRSEPESFSNGPENVFDDLDMAFEDDFNFPNDLMINEGQMLDTSLDTGADIAIEDDGVDEDLFWAALDFEAGEQVHDDEPLFEDLLDYDGDLLENLGTIESGFEEMGQHSLCLNQRIDEIPDPYESWDPGLQKQLNDNPTSVPNGDGTEILDECFGIGIEEMDDDILDEQQVISIDERKIYDTAAKDDESQSVDLPMLV